MTISLVRTKCGSCGYDGVSPIDGSAYFDEQHASEAWQCEECEVTWTEVYIHCESYDG